MKYFWHKIFILKFTMTSGEFFLHVFSIHAKGQRHQKAQGVLILSVQEERRC